MQRLLRCLVALGLVWLVTPLVSEAAENIWHLAVNGHSAHAIGAGAGHQPSDNEHGCSGTYHLCSCCHSLPAEIAVVPIPHLRAALAEKARSWSDFGHRPPFLGNLDRPPRA